MLIYPVVSAKTLSHFPGLLTAALQSHARKYNIPIDNISFLHYVSPLKTAAEEADIELAQKAGFTPAMWGYPVSLLSGLRQNLYNIEFFHFH